MNAHIEPDNDSGNASVTTRLGWHCDHLHSLAASRIFAHLARSMHSVEVSFSQIHTLFCLYNHGSQRIVDLAAQAHLSQCAASRLVSALVQAGLVEKVCNDANRRERLIRLTPAGLAYLKDLQQKTASAYEDVFQVVPRPLAQRLADILDEIMPLLPPPELAD